MGDERLVVVVGEGKQDGAELAERSPACPRPVQASLEQSGRLAWTGAQRSHHHQPAVARYRVGLRGEGGGTRGTGGTLWALALRRHLRIASAPLCCWCRQTGPTLGVLQAALSLTALRPRPLCRTPQPASRPPLPVTCVGCREGWVPVKGER